MPQPMPQLQTEWTIVGDAKSWMDALLDAHGSSAPFARVKLETRTTASLKRRDLTVLDRDGRVALTGEVKVPWALDGASPFVELTVRDARIKAEAAGSEWFFTWNLNELVLWRMDSFGDLGASRGFKTYSVSSLRRQTDLDNPRFEKELRDGIERFFLDFMRIYRGELELPQRPPDEYFIHAFDSFLAWPIINAKQALISRDGQASNRALIDRWMREEQGWVLVGDRADLLERAARFSCYAVANKLVFYDALRKRFSNLPVLEIPPTVTDGEGLVLRLSAYFDEARHVTHDYETVFGPIATDIGARIPFYDDGVVNGWRQLTHQLDRFDLSRLDYDVIGRIFERLIDPKERHKYGQYYTRPEVVDLINAFSIRNATDVVLDPGCGGGTFLVRAYARKKRLSPRLGHTALLEGVFGTDISPFAAHLSTINLATRDLVEDANYPRVKRADFFDLRAGSEFIRLPRADGGETPISVPRFDAVVGNPPYVRQEDMLTSAKQSYANVARRADLLVPGRSDLHVYFWGQALNLMGPRARLGFLASSQWLDAEYGFALQAWLLENFRIEAIVESRGEPWFVGARVATVATMAAREADPHVRDDNLIRFVQIRRPMAELLGGDGSSSGALEAAEELRGNILAAETDTSGNGWRIRVRRQGDIREMGVRLGERTKGQSIYAGGKWGIPLRAPDLWEDLIQIGGDRWRPLAEIADVRYGVKSGKDDFFYVTDWSQRGLEDFADGRAFSQHFGVERSLVVSGAVKLARTGTGEVHPIETAYLVPIVHSIMNIDAYRVERRHCNKLALMASNPTGAFVRRYIAWGEEQGVHEGSTCAARGRSRGWYDLTPDVIAADVLWVKERQYRFAALANPAHFAANCRLYTISFVNTVDAAVQSAILNSSLVVLSTLQFGRPVGVEGSWSTMVLDANMLLVPVAASPSPSLRKRLLAAHDSMINRSILGFLSDRRLRRKSLTDRGRETELSSISDETELDQADRRALDEAVLEMLGVTQARERGRLLNTLYAYLRAYFENVREKEEEAIDNKRRTANQSSLTAEQVANDVMEEIERDYPRILRTYSDLNAGTGGDGIHIPSSGLPIIVDDLVTRGVRFAEGRSAQIVTTRSLPQAELIVAIAEVGPRGRSLFVPADEADVRPLVDDLRRIAADRARIVEDLIAYRTSDPQLVSAARARVFNRLISGVSRPRRITALSESA